PTDFRSNPSPLALARASAVFEFVQSDDHLDVDTLCAAILHIRRVDSLVIGRKHHKLPMSDKDFCAICQHDLEWSKWRGRIEFSDLFYAHGTIKITNHPPSSNRSGLILSETLSRFF